MRTGDSMKTTIEIDNINLNKGKNKKGDNYLQTVIESKDGKKYSCFSKIENYDKLKKGSKIEIDYEVNGIYNNINSISLLPFAQEVEKKDIIPTPLSDAQIIAMMEKAKEMAMNFLNLKDKEILDHEEIIVYFFKARLQQQEQQFSLAQSKWIQAKKEQNIKRF